MTDDASPENLRKFLKSKDPALRRMGLSMAKATSVPNQVLPNLLRIYMWDSKPGLRKEAGSLYFSKAPAEVTRAFSENWKTSYYKSKTVNFIPLLEALENNSSHRKVVLNSVLAHYRSVLGENPNPSVSGKIIKILGQMGEPGKKLLLKILKKGLRPKIMYDVSNGASAARALSNINDIDITQALISALLGPEKIMMSSAASLVRLEAFDAINEIETRAISNSRYENRVILTGYLFELIVAQRMNALSIDDRVSGELEEVVLYYLAIIRGEGTAGMYEMQSHLCNLNKEIRITLFGVLKKVRNVGNEKRLKTDLGFIDELSEGEWFALMEMALEADFRNTKWAVARAMGTFSDWALAKQKSQKILVRMLDDKEQSIRITAAQSLGSIGEHKKAIKALEGLSDEGVNVDYSIKRLYEKDGDYDKLDIKDLRKICKRRRWVYASKTKTRSKDEIVKKLNSVDYEKEKARLEQKEPRELCIEYIRFGGEDSWKMRKEPEQHIPEIIGYLTDPWQEKNRENLYADLMGVSKFGQRRLIYMLEELYKEEEFDEMITKLGLTR